MQKTFKRKMSSLEDIFEFINEFSSQNGLDESIIFTLNLVVEEIFTNMVKYNPANTNDVLVDLEKKKRNLIINLTDFDVEPFDITRTAEVDTQQSLQARKVGGLGIHLVKQMMDKVDYEYKDRQSKITLIKHLES